MRGGIEDAVEDLDELAGDQGAGDQTAGQASDHDRPRLSPEEPGALLGRRPEDGEGNKGPATLGRTDDENQASARCSEEQPEAEGQAGQTRKAAGGQTRRGRHGDAGSGDVVHQGTDRRVNPSRDLLGVDEPTGRLCLTDRTNQGIHIFDATNDVYVGRVPGFLGVVNAPAGVTSQGPNGLLVTPENKLWVADGMAIMRVVDLNLSPPAIIQSIAVGPATDGRADEIAYDPVDHLIAVGFDAATPPYVAIVDADT